MSDATEKSFTRFLPPIGRWLLGLATILAGAMDLFHPMEPPPGMAAGAMAFSLALKQTGYMMPMIGIVLLGSGLLLAANRFVPLALLLLAPFFVNSVLFHAVLERSGLAPSVVLFALHLSLAWAYRGTFRAVLRAVNLPGKD